MSGKYSVLKITGKLESYFISYYFQVTGRKKLIPRMLQDSRIHCLCDKICGGSEHTL